uniref:E3 ubiquitin-protein ligase RNF25-like n=1 Tax=Phallusia mammillata TaxID=59560 RepID=A0A6F9DQC5_9ASCI|nr:E3 ubiquitin-protein ligase RNF25-like [Phallusia mammillata]
MSDKNEIESIDDEVMVLESIYEELEVTRNDRNQISNVGITLLPATANNAKVQHVKLQLRFDISEKYPITPLNVVFVSSRGMSDDHLQKLKDLLDKHIQQSQNENILFPLIEIAKDSLTSNNIPSSPCPICLFSFRAFDVFEKLECFHHMHSFCMFQYVTNYLGQQKQEALEAKKHNKHANIQNTGNQIPCPVCRILTTFDLDSLENSQEPVHNETSLNWNGIRRLMKSMNNTYERQKQCGGLIDLEAEKNKHLLSSIEQAYAASSNSIGSTKPDEKQTQTRRTGINIGRHQRRQLEDRLPAKDRSPGKFNTNNDKDDYRTFSKHCNTRKVKTNEQQLIEKGDQSHKTLGPRTFFKKSPNTRARLRVEHPTNRNYGESFPHSSGSRNSFFTQDPNRERNREPAFRNVKRPPESN